jgi:hypothetical protein
MDDCEGTMQKNVIAIYGAASGLRFFLLNLNWDSVFDKNALCSFLDLIKGFRASSKKCSVADPGCVLGIRDPEKISFRIPGPEVKKAPDPGSRYEKSPSPLSEIPSVQNSQTSDFFRIFGADSYSL